MLSPTHTAFGYDRVNFGHYRVNFDHYRATFCWAGVSFCRGSFCGAVFWICDQNNVDNRLIAEHLLSSVCTASRLLLFLTLNRFGGELLNTKLGFS